MKRLLAAAISAGLLALLFWKVDLAALGENFRRTRWGLFSLALTLFIPQILVIAWRWKRLVGPFTQLPLSESVRMVLAGATMNLFLPGKMGDLTKGWFLARRGDVGMRLGLGVVVFEKMLDIAALAIVMITGVILGVAGGLDGGIAGNLEGSVAGGVNGDMTGSLYGGLANVVDGSINGDGAALLAQLAVPLVLGTAIVAAVAILYFVPMERVPGMRWLAAHGNNGKLGKIHGLLRGSHETMAALRNRGARRGEIIALSLIIWTLHMAQIYLFFLSLNAAPPTAVFLAMVPLAIFIGVLPISIAGFGTRDAALIAFLPALPASAVLAAAMYINLRYIIPAIAGIPYLTRYAALRPGGARQT